MLDLYEMIRRGAIRPGADHAVSWCWTDKRTGAFIAEVAIIARLSDESAPHVRLVHLDSERTRLADYVIDLISVPQHFGGRRWWFMCPHTGQRVGKLFQPRGAVRFASRHAYRLAYRTQRSSPRDRAIRREHKLRATVGAEPNPFVPIVKPLRMRWATFDRQMAKIRRAEATACALAVPIVEALAKRVEGLRRRTAS